MGYPVYIFGFFSLYFILLLLILDCFAEQLLFKINLSTKRAQWNQAREI